MPGHSPDLSRARTILQKLSASWDVAAWLLVLIDSEDSFADDDLANRFFETLGDVIISLDLESREEARSAEGLEYLRDWRSAQIQTDFSFIPA